MLRLVLLIMLLMLAIFGIVTDLVAKKTGRRAADPVGDAIRSIAKPFQGADRIAPGIGDAIDRVDAELAELVKGEKAIGAPPSAATANINLSGADFTGARAPKSVYAGAIINETQFTTALLDGASFEGATGAGAKFVKARMAAANLSAAMLPRADFSGADLKGAALRAGDFSGGDFTGADLTNASLSAASIEDAVLARAFAPGGQFVDALAARADFSGTDLRAARFAGADLRDAVFAGADLSGADFAGARLQGADLSAAEGLTAEQIAAACGDASTKLPHGLTLTPCE